MWATISIRTYVKKIDKKNFKIFFKPHSTNTIEFANLKVVTKSGEDAFPSTLKLKRSDVKAVLGGDDNVEDGATIQEKCPKCGNPEMTYQTLQLRSADEGATVFYTCPKCQYKFRQNN